MMKIYIDNSLIRLYTNPMIREERRLLLDKYEDSISSFAGVDWQAILPWPCLVEYLDLSSLLKPLPPFDLKHPIFSSILSLLELNPEKEFFFHAYDQLFAETLTQIKNLPEVHPSFLLNKFEMRKEFYQNDPFHFHFSHSLLEHQKRLKEQPAHFMHDLILYLAWDRMCVWLGLIFETAQSSAEEGLNVLQECLIESFQHITAHGRTVPGFFRLIESLFALQMRENNLNTHSEEAWGYLCQSAPALMPRDCLQDVWYIDAALARKENMPSSVIKVVTLDSIEKINATRCLAAYMIEFLQKNYPSWNYTLCPAEIRPLA